MSPARPLAEAKSVWPVRRPDLAKSKQALPPGADVKREESSFSLDPFYRSPRQACELLVRNPGSGGFQPPAMRLRTESATTFADLGASCQRRLTLNDAPAAISSGTIHIRRHPERSDRLRRTRSRRTPSS